MKEVLESRMYNAFDAHLEEMRAVGLRDRRNGGFSSHLLTEVGDLELRIPRTPRFSAQELSRNSKEQRKNWARPFKKLKMRSIP